MFDKNVLYKNLNRRVRQPRITHKKKLDFYDDFYRFIFFTSMVPIYTFYSFIAKLLIIRTSIICLSLFSRTLPLEFLFQAEGLTAIECWVIACIIFVFGALLEYTVILLKLKIRKLKCTTNGSTKVKNCSKIIHGGNRPDKFTKTDLIFLCLFPILFLIFNLLYWTAVFWWRYQNYTDVL